MISDWERVKNVIEAMLDVAKKGKQESDGYTFMNGLYSGQEIALEILHKIVAEEVRKESLR